MDVLLKPVRSDRIRPRYLLENYASSDPESARLAVLSTLAVIYDAEEDVARRKGDHLRRAIVLLLASATVLLVGVTVEVGLVADLARLFRRHP